MNKLNRFSRYCIAIGLVGQVGVATATECSSVLASVGSYSLEYLQTNHPECFGSSGATSNTQITATAFAQATSISRSIAARTSPFASRPASTTSLKSGLAAGNAVQQWNVWGSVAQNNSEYSYNRGGVRAGENDVLATVIGADYAWVPNVVLGVSVAFDDGDGWGNTNGGAKNTNNTDGYMIAPYLGYQINQEWSADVSAGFGKGDFSAAGGITAEADRWFAAANLNYTRWMDNWQFTGKASYLHGEEKYANSKNNGTTVAGTASKNALDQIRINAQAGYWMNNGFMPYAGLGYTSNVSRTLTDPLGRDSLVATLGVNFFSLSSKVTGGIMYEQELTRKSSDNQVLSANINVRF